jgi:ankyrin repeat protein
LWQPPHEHWREFARLLLEAGADPNDNQALYNRMQYPNDEHLKLHFEYGLGKDQGGPWFQRFFQHWPHSSMPRSPSDILSYQLHWAISANYFDRVKLLVENGVDVNRPHGGVAPYAEAVSNGHQQIADYLVAKGAKRIAVSLSPADEFSIACNRADADRARELVASDPTLLDDVGGLLTGAAEEGQVDSLRLLVELGADVNGKAGCTSPLHCAARAGQLDVVKLLVELGADVHARDPDYDAIPLGFANYKGQRAVVEYLLQFARIWEAWRDGYVDVVAEYGKMSVEEARDRWNDQIETIRAAGTYAAWLVPVVSGTVR